MQLSAGWLPRYVSDLDELARVRERLRQYRCPHCGVDGMLHGHGWRYGCGEGVAGRVLRGWRVFCSNRYRKNGCGRTFPVLLAGCIAEHTVGGARLWGFLREYARAGCVITAWERLCCGFSLQSARRWLRRMYWNQSQVRTLLCRLRAPPLGADTQKPLADVVAHLQAALGEGCVDSPIAAFQTQFQTGWPMASNAAAGS